MKVSDLAADLEVPASTILDQCQRFGIDASWAGAELSGADVVVLRAELAAADPIDLTPADRPAPSDDAPAVLDADTADTVEAEAPAAIDAPEPDPVAAADPDTAAVAEAESGADSDSDSDSEPETEAVVPPTAVGSMPELLDEITPELEPPGGEASAARGPGFAMAGEGGGVDPNATRRVPPRAVPVKRRIEKGARNSVIALLIAVACLVASNFTELAAVVALLWLVAAIALIVAVLDGFRGRRRVQTHPERLHGVWLASISLVLAIGGLVGLTSAAFAAIGDKPAADAPASLGDLQSVQVARWGYQRVHRFSGNGWNQPARPVGSCWAVDISHPRDEQRVEISKLAELTGCKTQHTLQVMKVFSVNHDADAPYPGTAKLLTLGQQECSAITKRLVAKDVTFAMKIEFPTEVGWSDGDHDVACVAVTPMRKAPFKA